MIRQHTTRALTSTLVLTTLGLIGLAAPALAAPEPTLSDIAACNEQAATRTGAGAMPHPGSRPPDTARRGESSRGTVPAPGAPGAGRIRAPGPDTTPPGGAPSEKTDPSGSVITQTPDPLARGMDASKADDPQYRAAYRDCMRAKLGAR
jgi:hypothetical protein